MSEHLAIYDVRYEEMLHAMQRGDWTEAQALLEALQQDYPDDSDLENIAFEMQCKSKLSSYWTSKLSARLPHIDTVRLLRWAVALFVIAFIAYEALTLNTNVLQPTQAVNAEVLTKQQLLIAGDQAFAEGQYEDAQKP